MSGNRPVRQREFDLWRDPWERAIRDLQEWRRDHERNHDQDEDDEVAADREGRRERWRQFAAWMAVLAALLAAFWTNGPAR